MFIILDPNGMPVAAIEAGYEDAYYEAPSSAAISTGSALRQQSDASSSASSRFTSSSAISNQSSVGSDMASQVSPATAF